jgi:hypothetical protein
MIDMVKRIHEKSDETLIVAEITYLLHIRKVNQEYDRRGSGSMEGQLNLLLNSYSQFEYNYKVLVVLIESGYIQSVLMANLQEYPKFLVGILDNSDRGLVKEACCRRIIKFFGKSRKDDGADEGDAGKIEFITLVEPLTSIITRSKENGARLTALSVMAIVNMCTFSEDIKDIFL